MKSILKKDRVLVILALLGLLASLFPLGSRIRAEENNKYYDIILDYSSLRAMARQSSQTEDEWLDLFRSLGVDKVALGEASAMDLSQSAAIPVHTMTVKKAMADGYGLSTVSVAAGRVYEYTVHGLHLLQMADAVCVADGDVVQAEDREVVCGYLAEGFLALDVSGMPEAGGEIGAVDAETSGEVGKGAG